MQNAEAFFKMLDPHRHPSYARRFTGVEKALDDIGEGENQHRDVEYDLETLASTPFKRYRMQTGMKQVVKQGNRKKHKSDSYDRSEEGVDVTAQQPEGHQRQKERLHREKSVKRVYK